MVKGRKALPGTHEAREKIKIICKAIQECNVSDDAKKRVIKAIKFGLGIKEEEKNVFILKEKKEKIKPF
ncbi:MAG: hypothetical protein ACTSYZ_12580 [Candidatus Helarchaeota archaeon]